MRVGVSRLDLALRLAELGALLHPVVAVGSTGREEHAERAEEELEVVAAVAQAREQARVEIAGGRVKGAVERLLVPVERIPVLLGEPLPHVDGLEAGGRGNREVYLGCCAHVAASVGGWGGSTQAKAEAPERSRLDKGRWQWDLGGMRRFWAAMVKSTFPWVALAAAGPWDLASAASPPEPTDVVPGHDPGGRGA